MNRRPSPPAGQFALFEDTAPLREVRHMVELPDTAHALIEVIGLQATIDLVRTHGGDELKIPAIAGGDSRAWALLEESIGRAAAAKLVESHFRGTPVYVPMCQAALRAARDRQIMQRLADGEGFDEVRRSVRLSRSYLFRLVRKKGD